MNIFFYFTLSITALLFIGFSPEYTSNNTRSSLNLCKLREGQRGRVTAIITKIEPGRKDEFTIVDPKTGCKSLVIGGDLPHELQRGISFKAVVQAGFLKLPTDIILEDNVGRVIAYQEINNYMRTKPREIDRDNTVMIDLRDSNDRIISLYISRKLARQIKYNSYNTFKFDSNRTIQSVINN